MSGEKAFRSKNFTEKEKEVAIAIIEKYRTVLENKCTDGGSMKIRREAWQNVADEFNSLAVSVPRNGQQMKILWSNLRRQAKKTVAEENKRKFNSDDEDFDYEDADEDLEVLKKIKINDKKNSSKTGGGSYKPQLSEMGARVLAIVEPQAKPLPNQYDDNNYYHGDISLSSLPGSSMSPVHNMCEEVIMEIPIIEEDTPIIPHLNKYARPENPK